MDMILGNIYAAVALCVVTAIFLAVAFISFILKKHKIERAMGILALISTVVSCLMYYYLRFTLSGGTLADWRVTFVLAIYLIAGALSVLSVVDGTRKIRFARN